MLFTDERYFAFTFEYLLAVQVHFFRFIHHCNPDSIYLDASLHVPFRVSRTLFRSLRQVIGVKGPKYRTW